MYQQGPCTVTVVLCCVVCFVHCTIQYCTALCWTVINGTVLYCTVLQYTVLHYTVLQAVSRASSAWLV